MSKSKFNFSVSLTEKELALFGDEISKEKKRYAKRVAKVINSLPKKYKKLAFFIASTNPDLQLYPLLFDVEVEQFKNKIDDSGDINEQIIKKD